MKRTKQNDDNFIMLPTVDFCFKELMRNPKVRKGFIAAVLGKKPEEIRDTTLIPTELRKESEDDKLGILDVLVEPADETKMNMELQVSYFECWINRVLFYLSKIYSGQIRGGEKNMTGCTAASMSGSSTLSISLTIRNAAENSPSATWKQGNSIPT